MVEVQVFPFDASALYFFLCQITQWSQIRCNIDKNSLHITINLNCVSHKFIHLNLSTMHQKYTLNCSIGVKWTIRRYCLNEENVRIMVHLQWNPFLATSRIATTVDITTDLQIPIFFLSLSHVIYFYNNEYKKSLSSVITTTWSESLVAKRRETRYNFAWENNLKHFDWQYPPHKQSLTVADTFFGLASPISIKHSQRVVSDTSSPD